MLLNMEVGKDDTLISQELMWPSSRPTGKPWVPVLTLQQSNGMCVLVTQSCPTLCNQSHGLKPTRLLCPWNSPVKNTGAGSHFLLQRTFPTQGLKPHLFCLLHCRQKLYHLSHQESPWAIPTLPGLWFIRSSTYLACLIGLMWQWNKQRMWKTIEPVKQQRVNWQECGCTDSCSYRGSFVWF